jgi:hypothetical protein
VARSWPSSPQAPSPQPPLQRGEDEAGETKAGWPGSSPHGHACEWV